jgi:hypothetical protein
MTHVPSQPTTPAPSPLSRSDRRAAARSRTGGTAGAVLPPRSVPSPRGAAVRTATAFRRRG